MWEFLPSQQLHFPQLCPLSSSNWEIGRLRLIRAVTLVLPQTAAFMWSEHRADLLQLYSPHLQQLYHCSHLTANHSMPSSCDTPKSLFNLIWDIPHIHNLRLLQSRHFIYRLGVTIQHHREHWKDDSTTDSKTSMSLPTATYWKKRQTTNTFKSLRFSTLHWYLTVQTRNDRT